MAHLERAGDKCPVTEQPPQKTLLELERLDRSQPHRGGPAPHPSARRAARRRRNRRSIWGGRRRERSAALIDGGGWVTIAAKPSDKIQKTSECEERMSKHPGLDLVERARALAPLIAREAGAAVSDAFGQALGYNKPDPRAFGVLVTAPAIHSAAVGRLATRARELAAR